MDEEESQLLQNIAHALPQLGELLQRANDRRVYEDGVYRFYHQSLKVFRLQEQTTEIVHALQGLAPNRPLNDWFLQIVSEGIDKTFTAETNQRWMEETCPILEAFFHARYFLEMVCKYGGQPQSTLDGPMPSGLAAVLYLYGLR